MTTKLVLYGTEHCHLCEQAAALVLPACQASGLSLTEIDIAGDPALMEAYGLRIPVLSAADAELDWPFDGDRVQAFLSGAVLSRRKD